VCDRIVAGARTGSAGHLNLGQRPQGTVNRCSGKFLTAARDIGRLHDIATILVRYGFGDLVRRVGLSHALERAGRRSTGVTLKNSRI